MLRRMHYSSKYYNAPMPYSIFYRGGYAIHGTSAIRALGRRASHGCIRLHNANARELYQMVQDFGKGSTQIIIR
jgi:lipoprotein-anchoring transpeptidase ErfK/SrfK